MVSGKFLKTNQITKHHHNHQEKKKREECAGRFLFAPVFCSRSIALLFGLVMLVIAVN